MPQMDYACELRLGPAEWSSMYMYRPTRAVLQKGTKCYFVVANEHPIYHGYPHENAGTGW